MFYNQMKILTSVCAILLFFDELDQKIDNPNRVCEATPNELVTEGGELKFIEKIIEDSLIFKERIIWYTSLIGRKVTLKKSSTNFTQS